MRFLVTLLTAFYITPVIADNHLWLANEHGHFYNQSNNQHVKKMHHKDEHHYKNHSGSHFHGDAGTSQRHLD